jgi:hypothetical protein
MCRSVKYVSHDLSMANNLVVSQTDPTLARQHHLVRGLIDSTNLTYHDQIDGT